jgi:hypothetical protein
MGGVSRGGGSRSGVGVGVGFGAALAGGTGGGAEVAGRRAQELSAIATAMATSASAAPEAPRRRLEDGPDLTGARRPRSLPDHRE